MTAVGFFRATAIVAAKDLRLEWRTWDTLGSTTVFSVIVLVVFQFAFGIGTVREVGVQHLIPGVLWSALVFASVVGMARSMQVERDGGTLTALFQTPVDRGALFAGKALANLVKLTVLQWVLLPLTALFFDVAVGRALGPLLLVLFLHGVGLTVLGTLFAAVTARLGRGEALLATLLFPAVTPLLASAVKCTGAILAGRPLTSVSHWLAISIGFDLLYLFVGLLTFEFVMEE